MKKKLSYVKIPAGTIFWPVLIHVNGVTETLLEQRYFVQMIDFSELLSV